MKDYKNETFIHLFEEQVRKTPDNIALNDSANIRLTYKQADRLAGFLGLKLRAMGLSRNDIVAVLLERTAMFPLACVGIFKCGAAYMPVDVKYPAERIGYMLGDSNTKVLITTRGLLHLAKEFTGKILFMEDLHAEIEDTDYPIEIITDERDTAYVIYTSGTTGKPKGSLNTHKSMVNLFRYSIAEYGITDNDVSGVYSSFGFDVSLLEIFTFLTCGACVDVIPRDVLLDMYGLEQYINGHGITFTLLPPPVAKLYDAVAGKNSLRTIVAAGDVLSMKPSDKYKLYNGYGPTETCIIASSFFVDKAYDNIPIGKPVSGSYFYIANENMELVPDGEAGELYIGGACVGNGYLNRDELTREKFIKNKFSSDENQPILYKTGDSCKRLPDGNYLYLGRIDSQIKLHGYRIELGEIESVMRGFSGVKDAVCAAFADTGGEKYICGYYTADSVLDESAIKQFLLLKLPEYMVPSGFEKIDEIPLSINGKYNRNALKPIERKFKEEESSRAGNDKERALLSCVERVLNIKSPSLSLSFAQIGGDSLSAIKLLTELRELGYSAAAYDILDTGNSLSRVAGMLVKAAQKQERKVRESVYDLTPTQRGMLYYYLLNPKTVEYIDQMLYKVEGELDLPLCKTAFLLTAEKHPVLKTAILYSDRETPKQTIVSDRVMEVKGIVLKDEGLDKILERDLSRGFDFENDNLIRMTVLKESDESYYLLVSFAHIILDGWSMSVLMNDFIMFYEKLAAGAEREGLMNEAREWADGNGSFYDFVCELRSMDFSDAEAYYKNMLAHYETEGNLYKDFKNGNKAYGEKLTGLSPEIISAVNRIAKECGVSDAAIYESVYALMLQKYCGSTDVVFGKTVYGRNYPMDGIAGIAGLFINTLPARVEEGDNDSFADFFMRVQRRIDGERKYELCDLSEIQKKTPQRDALLQTLFAYNKFPDILGGNENALFKLSLYKEVQKTHFNFGLIVNPGNNFTIQYNSGVYSDRTIDDFAAAYVYLLEQAVKDVNLKLSKAKVVPAERQAALLELARGPVKNGWRDKTYCELFTEQARRTPDGIALKDCMDGSLTYRQLDNITNRLAKRLMEEGYGNKEPVGIMMSRTVLFPVAAIAVMKAGQAYLPIDMEYPEDIIRYMLESSGTKLLLTCGAYEAHARYYCSNVINVSDYMKFADEDMPFESVGKPSDWAYIIHTSGSSGRPKGTAMTHKNLVSLCRWSIDRFGEGINSIAAASFSFDMSIEQIYPRLISGGTLIIADERLRGDMSRFCELVERENVAYMMLPTALSKIFMEHYKGSALKILAAGGEKLNSFPPPESYIVCNIYGPTEYTVVSTSFFVDKEYDNVPVGKVVDNTSAVVLDRHGNMLPLGALGELCLSGRQMSDGYISNPELTKEKYIPNPYAYDEDTQILYKTGDLARLLPDGNFECHGRMDNQVKIRGFRIELGEVEVAMGTHPDISRAICVAAKAGADNPFICCYYVSEREISHEELHAHGLSKLAKHMVPSVFMRLDEIPVTPSGKIDKRALPKAEFKAVEEYEAPVSDIERKLAEVYCETLMISRFSRGADFFAMGGTSLQAISAAAKLKAFYDITINKIYEYPVLKVLAEELEKQGNQPKTVLKQVLNLTAGQGFELEKIEAAKAEYRSGIERLKPIDASARAEYKTVLLCGATGYLGAYLLEELTNNYDVKIIVIVRADGNETAAKRVLEKCIYYFDRNVMSHKVEVMAGDLSEQGFGLSAEDYNRLAGQVDLVINAAANVKHYGHHAEFEKANITTVENLIAFCKTAKKKDFAQTSTVSVADGNIAGTAHAVFTEDNVDIGQKSDNYYISTKLAAERITIAARADGLNTSIFRLGNIAIDTKKHRLQANIAENAFFKVLDGFVNMSVIAREFALAELSFVDQCADAICRLSFCPDTQNGTYHIQNHNVADIAKILTGDLEMAIEVKDTRSFVEFLSHNLTRSDIGGYIENVMTHLDALDPGIATKTEVLSGKTVYCLEQLGFSWKQADSEIIKELVKKALRAKMDFIRPLPYFDRLDEESIFSLAGIMVSEIYGESAFVRHEDKKYSRLMFVRAGMGEMFMTSQSGWEGTVEIVKKGELVGIDALLGKRSAVTLEAVFDEIGVYSIAADSLNKLFTKHPHIATAFIGYLSDKLTKNQKFWVNVE